MNNKKELGIFFDTVIPQFVKQRKKLGLSQNTVDDLIGCARGLVSKWEVGMRKPSGFLFCCWADTLKCDIKLKERKKG
jgi:transcriptional regulator with XRE-family HTH domain|tara:strand:+ start:380 stop:613 length:234 start_codon:yes stop_codon:yes gene_type:complete